MEKRFELNSKNYAILVVLIILASFFLYSTTFYPAVNSDMAINVLMANDFSWPDDVYFWGQNRLGSFIPMTANALMQATGISAVLAVSLCNYLVITLGFLGFSTLFKARFSKLIFALLWFFPFQSFLGLNVFPLGLSYGLFGFAILLFQGVNLKEVKWFSLRNLTLSILILATLVCAVWISDLMMVTLCILWCSILFRIILSRNFRNRRHYTYLLLHSIFLLVIFFIDLVYFKSLAVVEIKDFGGLNSLDQLGEAFSIVGGGLWFRFFSSGLNIITLGSYVLLTSLVIGLYCFVLRFLTYVTLKDFWTSFFFLDFFGILGVIFLSHWVLLNEMGNWYFVAPYISASIWILRIFEKENVFNGMKFRIAFLLGVLCINVGPIWEHFRVFGNYNSTVAQVRELDHLGKIGVVGTYWESYKFSLAYPKKVLSTPHQGSDIRKKERILETFLQDRIFLVKDNWLTSFPDTISQFGFNLKQFGKPFKAAGSTFCEYKVIFNKEIEEGKLLTLLGNQFHTNGSFSSEDLVLRFDDNRVEQYHSLYGPKIALPKGKYEARLYLNEFDALELGKSLFIDISFNGGLDTPVAMFLGDAKRVGRYFVFQFEIEKPILDWEFRFHEEKQQNFVFDHLELERIK